MVDSIIIIAAHKWVPASKLSNMVVVSLLIELLVSVVRSRVHREVPSVVSIRVR